MARGRGVAVLGPRLGIRGLTRGMWGGNGDVKINVRKLGCVPRCRVAGKFVSSCDLCCWCAANAVHGGVATVGRGRLVGVVASRALSLCGRCLGRPSPWILSACAPPLLASCTCWRDDVADPSSLGDPFSFYALQHG